MKQNMYDPLYLHKMCILILFEFFSQNRSKRYLSVTKPYLHCHGSDDDSPRFNSNDVIVMNRGETSFKRHSSIIVCNHGKSSDTVAWS